MITEHSGSPDVGEAKVQIGYTYFKEKNYDEALVNYLEALNNYSDRIDSSHVYFDLISTYYEMNRYDEAIAAFDYVKFGSPFYTAALVNLQKFMVLAANTIKERNFLRIF